MKISLFVIIYLGDEMKEFCILVLLFYCYSFVGWLIEIVVTLVKMHKFINRGFLIGPLCPIYGFGGVLITLLLNRYSNDPLVLFIMAIILCAVLEYLTSYIMEKIFKNRWWDYSDIKFNINGRICLECAIPFGIGGIIMFYGVNPILISLFSHFNLLALEIITIFLLIITIVDIIISFNVIISLKNISNSIRCDSTEIITKKVKEALNSKTILHKRLIASFPDMKVFNKIYILKDKLNKDKIKLNKEIKQTKRRKSK